MYVNSHFKVHPATSLAFAGSRGFGLVIASDGGRPVASPLPFRLIEQDGKVPKLEFHVARANQLGQIAEKGGTWLVAVQGHDAYVSPDWYASAEQVPTWLYEAVHLSGPVRVIPGDHTRGHTERLSHTFEKWLAPKSEWKLEKVADKRREMLLTAIVAVEMTIETIEGQSVPDYWVSVRDKARFLEHLRRRGRVDDMETELRSQSGRVFWARVSAQRLRFAGEDALLGALVDITDQRRAQDRLRELATRDSLTDVYNRRHLEEIARKELARSERNGRPLTMAMLDVDHFKQINDTYGHQVGDEVLCEIARRFAKSIRASDILGRYGGEEFVVIFPETNLEEARVVSERLLTAVAGQPIAAGRGAISVTVSIGLTTFVSGQDMERVIERADAALYVAKANGRNQVRVGDADVPGRTPTPVLVDRRSGSHRPS